MSLISTNILTMSSMEIADLVGSRHDSVKRTIERLAEKHVISQPPLVDGPRSGNGVVTQEYQVSKRDSFVVVAQLSPEFTAALVDRWQELEAQASRPMTTAEIIAASANQLVQIERQQAEHQAKLEHVEQRIEDLSHTTVWDHCPQNCQSLTRIKETMLARHGLSGAVVDYVLKEWPNQPHPAGMVRNGHEEAQGAQYLVWSKSHVTAAFHRFVSESTMVTATQAVHPYFEGRFRLASKANP